MSKTRTIIQLLASKTSETIRSIIRTVGLAVLIVLAVFQLVILPFCLIFPILALEAFASGYVYLGVASVILTITSTLSLYAISSTEPVPADTTRTQPARKSPSPCHLDEHTREEVYESYWKEKDKQKQVLEESWVSHQECSECCKY